MEVQTMDNKVQLFLEKKFRLPKRSTVYERDLTKENHDLRKIVEGLSVQLKNLEKRIDR